MARPRKYQLPKGLTYDKATNRYRYTDPITGKRRYVGNDRAKACLIAEQGTSIRTRRYPDIPLIRSDVSGSRDRIIRQQTPPWADQDRIRVIYVIARHLTDIGQPHHVDHVYPLQGKYVSGLHCEDNLAVIPATDNCSKGNDYSPLETETRI